MQERAAGILLHPTALPGGHGVGDLGPAARSLLGWMEAAGQTVWQILPLGPTGHGDAPYGTTSAFAGNPLLISGEDLVSEDLLPASALDVLAPDRTGGGETAERVDFAKVRDRKDWMLRESWRAVQGQGDQPILAELESFESAERAAVWLDDWALYAALKERHDGASWTRWPIELRDRQPDALRAAREELADEIRFQIWVQFLFHRQWRRLRAEAGRRGVRIFGDVPIYVIGDSADVWSNQSLFSLDDDGLPLELSGCPPDDFGEDGQLWGQPVYRWDRMRETGYAWWLARMRSAFEQVDIVRLDHFRGFAGYWSVPSGSETAREGRWVDGPGSDLFEAFAQGLGDVEIIAEDLGVITPDVVELRERFDLAGMKILQFAFGELDSPHAPHRHSQHAVVYTGTHDNDTTRGWYDSLDEPTRHFAREYLSRDGDDIAWDLIRSAYQSVARTAIVPMQDVLDLGSEARFNTPGVAQGNWAWRLTALPGDEDALRLRRLTELSGRLSAPVPEGGAGRSGFAGDDGG